MDSASSLRPAALAQIALFAVLMAICAWITIPSPVPFTMQTFGLFLTLSLLGGRKGFYAVCVYLLMGLVGLPVFSGFQGGLGVLLGASGGYLTGFFFAALLYWGLTARRNPGTRATAAALLFSLLACYACGTLWFLLAYASGFHEIGNVLSLCVVPFLIPDACKLALALAVSRRLEKSGWRCM